MVLGRGPRHENETVGETSDGRRSTSVLAGHVRLEASAACWRSATRAIPAAASRCTPSTAARSCSAPTPPAAGRARAARARPSTRPTRAVRRRAAVAGARRPRPAVSPTEVYARVVEKLRREPVEDFRIDFEDGYGNRPDAEEDGHAVPPPARWREGCAGGHAAAVHRHPHQAAHGRAAPRAACAPRHLPHHAGRRDRRRSCRRTSSSRCRRSWCPEQVRGAAPTLFDALETALGLADRRAALRADGRDAAVDLRRTRRRLRAAAPRSTPATAACTGAHFGTYDYTAACNITAAHQHMTHPACDFARHVMQVALAGTGVRLSDGATNVMPVAPHRATAGATADAEQREENRGRPPRLEAALRRRPPLAGARLLPGLGPAPGAARRPATPRSTRSSSRASSRPPSGCATSSTRRRRPRSSATSSTTPPPARACSTTSCAAINCGAITEDEALADRPHPRRAARPLVRADHEGAARVVSACGSTRPRPSRPGPSHRAPRAGGRCRRRLSGSGCRPW